MLPTYVAGSTHKTPVFGVQAHQLLVAQEQEARHPQDRAQEVLQMVSEVDASQGSQEVADWRNSRENHILMNAGLAQRFSKGRLVKWYNCGLQNRCRGFDSLTARKITRTTHASADYILRGSEGIEGKFGVSRSAERVEFPGPRKIPNRRIRNLFLADSDSPANVQEVAQRPIGDSCAAVRESKDFAGYPFRRTGRKIVVRRSFDSTESKRALDRFPHRIRKGIEIGRGELEASHLGKQAA